MVVGASAQSHSDSRFGEQFLRLLDVEFALSMSLLWPLTPGATMIAAAGTERPRMIDFLIFAVHRQRQCLTYALVPNGFLP